MEGQPISIILSTIYMTTHCHFERPYNSRIIGVLSNKSPSYNDEASLIAVFANQHSINYLIWSRTWLGDNHYLHQVLSLSLFLFTSVPRIFFLMLWLYRLKSPYACGMYVYCLTAVAFERTSHMHMESSVYKLTQLVLVTGEVCRVSLFLNATLKNTLTQRHLNCDL